MRKNKLIENVETNEPLNLNMYIEFLKLVKIYEYVYSNLKDEKEKNVYKYKIIRLKLGLSIKEYTAAPIYMSDENTGAHEWLIEFDEDPKNLKEFTSLLDLNLQAINSDYEAKRHKNIALGMPQITAVHKGCFHEWLKQKGKLGGQHKVPRLSNERIYVDEIKKIHQSLK